MHQSLSSHTWHPDIEEAPFLEASATQCAATELTGFWWSERRPRTWNSSTDAPTSVRLVCLLRLRTVLRILNVGFYQQLAISQKRKSNSTASSLGFRSAVRKPNRILDFGSPLSTLAVSSGSSWSESSVRLTFEWGRIRHWWSSWDRAVLRGSHRFVYVRRKPWQDVLSQFV